MVDENNGPQNQQEPADVVAIVKDMSKFERAMLRLTAFGIVLAIATGAIFYAQLKWMAAQTQIMASQFEGAHAGGLMDEHNTRRQLGIAQEQAKAAQESVTAIRAQMRQDQRPLLKPGMSFAHKRLAVGETISGSVTIPHV